MPDKNHLGKEKSPYLLQHAENPVDWYPWNDEAFEKAKKEDKPVFLSIGYSTCHWCHVMAHESFEDEEVAKLMNDAFISIKVDREERPDIDGIYMTVCQMLTGSGGWPLTIIMTPEKKPFFAGTYFPKKERFNLIGMMQLIPRIKELWNSKRDEIQNSADEISASLKNENSSAGIENNIDEKIFDKAFEYFLNNFDSTFGGFGTAPKFPTPHNLMFLLRYWKRKKEPAALKMVELTLKKIRSGGIYDHAGFGFHRYSTDRQWLVPHFEKMLYDQALLCMAYTETFLATKDNFYKDTAEEILTYILRDMTSPNGGFYSAEDADSEGEEGKFYLWDEEEIKNVLGEDAGFILKIFNIKPEGNWIEQSHGSPDGTNILNMPKSIEELAAELKIEVPELKSKIELCRQKLFDQREKRIHPYKDDKILTDWNSLMISALAKAYQAFGNDKLLKAAELAAEFILKKLMLNEGSLLHRFREDEAAIPGSVDDYAFFIAALIDLYESAFDPEYLKSALTLNEYLLKHFWDDEHGGFFFANDGSCDLLIRQKEIYDGAVPSGNSVAILNMLRLGRIRGNSDFETRAQQIADAFSKSIFDSPYAFTQALIALDFSFGPSFEIVIAGDKKSDDTENLLKKIRGQFIPNKILLLNDDDEIKNLAPYISGQTKINNRAAAYVCRNFVCSLPVTEAADLEKLLNEIK